MPKLRDQLSRREGLPGAQGEADDAVNLPLALLMGRRWATEAAAAGRGGPHMPRNQAHAGG